ncbi:hypothetical protein [Providencia sp. Je.9.19]|uniref:hypothetical protein n=1 Tax=Providencia sp. Je.9.19 TaxID=3142844 RepID=UPI003DA942EC
MNNKVALYSSSELESWNGESFILKANKKITDPELRILLGKDFDGNDVVLKKQNADICGHNIQLNAPAYGDFTLRMIVGLSLKIIDLENEINELKSKN